MEEFFVRAESVRAYYAKLSEPGPGDKEQYNREAASIQHITRKSPEIEDENADLNEYSFMRPLDPVSTSILAKRLALELHTDRSRNGKYGFACPGPTRTQGKWFNTWAECFADMITSLLQGLHADQKYPALFHLQEDVVNIVIPFLLGPPLEVEPVLLHGDLWVGNVGVDKSTQYPVVYDPSSYYGHNEAELSIMRMFRGFPPAFFTEYHKYRPKSKPVDEYDMRQMLYRLFHCLNHSSILQEFMWAPEAERCMKALIAYVKGHSGGPRG